ncbi:hypothetical protein HYU14_07490 [Candidatus Woesearchaeota archaeon]|nr:hypothetical protein [Candidatus Woesearchaeota archaeon]
MKYALNDHKELKWLILYYAVIGGAGFTMVWLIQPYFKAAGLPLAFFGIVWALLQFSAGYFSLAAGSIERFFGRKASVVSLIFLSSIGFVLASYVNTLWAIAVVLIFYFVRGIIIPIFKDYINRLISSDIRATVLSVQALMARLAFSITGPIIGWVSDSYGMQTAFKASSGLFLLLGVVCLLFLKKHDGI